MKMIRNCCFMVLIVASLSLFVGVSDSRAEVSSLGEVCINLTSDYKTSIYNVPNKTAQLGILSYGAGYFSLNGKITDENGRIMPALGTAIINAGNAVLTLTANDGTFAYSETYYITVDRETWQGVFSSIVHQEESITFRPPSPDQIVSRYDKGNASLHDCP